MIASNIYHCEIKAYNIMYNKTAETANKTAFNDLTIHFIRLKPQFFLTI